MLVAHHDPPFASAFEVCDRINHSSSPETVGKEATRAIRRTLKSGNEQERRTAAKVWLIMMQNVSAKGFRGEEAGTLSDLADLPSERVEQEVHGLAGTYLAASVWQTPCQSSHSPAPSGYSGRFDVSIWW